MYFPTFLMAILMASAINASAIQQRQEEEVPQCDEAPPSEEFVEYSKTLQHNSSSLETRQAQKRYNFRVYAHVVYSEKNSKGGYVSEENVKKDIDLLNKRYSRAGISFTHAETDYLQNSAWAHSNDPAMKNKLRRGGYADLNLYYVAKIPGKLISGGPIGGHCTYPIVPRGNSLTVPQATMERDGCVMIATSVPGGSSWSDLSPLTTHEVGHWLGLRHTFEGGCKDGDTIDDTFPQEKPTGKCENQPKLPDGRPGAYACGGLHPSNSLNFMDYSSEFTLGQEQRMRQWADSRQKLGGSSTEQKPPENPKPKPKPNPPTPKPPSNSGESKVWGQCGGRDWKGPTACSKGLVCKHFGVWYSQCVPAA
ncbi:Cellulose-binding domain, fungal [Metarhizium brunneum]